MNEVFDALIRANVAGAAAVVLVLAIRPLARRWLGAEVAYRFWLLPLVSMVAAVAPARRFAASAALTEPSGPPLVGLWLVGAALIALWFAALQFHYSRLARRGQAGPAVIGVIVPRVHMPADDGAFTPAERAVIRAHEREHIARGDPAWNAVLAQLQCLFWCNPFVHLAARMMREDQELACDAAVLRRHAPSRAIYAQALLKAQMRTYPMPLGASWLSGGVHPLEIRIGLLTRRQPSAAVLAPLVMLLLSLLVAVVTWHAQPPAHRISPDQLPTLDLTPMMAVLLVLALAITSNWRPGGELRRQRTRAAR